jgi:hypothetical protein
MPSDENDQARIDLTRKLPTERGPHGSLISAGGNVWFGAELTRS